MSGRPRALWVTAVPPSFSGGGGHIRQAHLLKALGTRFDVDLMVAGGSVADEVRDMVDRVHHIAAPPAEPDVSPLGKLRDVALTHLGGAHTEVGLLRDVRREMAGVLAAIREPDLVQVEFVSLWPLIEQRRNEHWAITLHNLGSGMSTQRSAVASKRRTAAYHRSQAGNAALVERRVVDRFDTTIAVSDADADALAGAPLVVANGVDLSQFAATPIPSEPKVVFTGALYTDPNVDGVRWLIDEIWPRVRRRRSDAELAVVGMAPPRAVRDACSSATGVTLHADVPSTAPFLGQARIAVVPLRIGTGSRPKALEAMAAQRAVVGTTVGMGGIDYRPGHHAVVADDAMGFADAVVALLDHSGDAQALARRGRSLVEARYAWTRIGDAYADAMAERVTGSANT